MEIPAIPTNEAERLNAVYNFGILDTISEEEYDAITQIAAQICGTSISLITILDESHNGLKAKLGWMIPKLLETLPFAVMPFTTLMR